MRNVKIQTSNCMKKAEFEALGYTVVSGEIPEVMGTPDEVILHKARLADPFVAVEDTYIVMDGKPIVDWKTSFLDYYPEMDGKCFEWMVRIAYNDGEKIHVFDGSLKCRFDLGDIVPVSANFDDYARVQVFFDGCYVSEAKEHKDWFSINPRSRALYNMTWNESSLTVPLSILKDWEGEYQP